MKEKGIEKKTRGREQKWRRIEGDEKAEHIREEEEEGNREIDQKES